MVFKLITYVFLNIVLLINQAGSEEYQTLSSLKRDQKIAEIKKRGVLLVAMHKNDHPPFFMHDDAGELIGIDVEFARSLAQQLGVKVHFDRSQSNFNAVVALVANRTCDIAISKLSVTLPRSEYVLYSEPYLELSKALIINRSKLLSIPYDINVRELFKLEGFTIGVIANSSYEAFAKRILGAEKLFSHPDWEGHIIPKILKGEIWAGYRDQLEVRRIMYSVKDAPLKLMVINLKDEGDPQCACVHRDDNHFRDYINHFIEIVYKRRTLQDELRRYEKMAHLPKGDL